jgi:hypothetical protein
MEKMDYNQLGNNFYMHFYFNKALNLKRIKSTKRIICLYGEAGIPQSDTNFSHLALEKEVLNNTIHST